MKDNLALFEVDGLKDKLYCQCLCLLSKLFLDHKTVYYDLQHFLFYILFELDEETKEQHIVGYFSKERESTESYNLACIMVLPPYQRKGYGRFLIELSYELNKRSGTLGTPERPLSDLGLATYRKYWGEKLIGILYELTKKGATAKRRARQTGESVPSISDLATTTGFMTEDIEDTLEDLHLLSYKNGVPMIDFKTDKIEEYSRTMLRQSNESTKAHHKFDPDFLEWTPHSFY